MSIYFDSEKVGPEENREIVAETVFRTIDRDGVAAATVLSVAREANLAEETVRQYFSDTRKLLVFVREMIYGRLAQPLDQLSSPIISADPAVTRDERHAAIVNTLAQFLPMDEERRRDAKVWLACCVHAATRPDLESETHFFPTSMRKGFPRIFAEAQKAGIFADGLDVGIETERLIALLDGLGLTVLLHPGVMPPERALVVLRRHLDSLGSDGS